MYLSKNGVTVDVTHPSDIQRYKKLGYVEEPGLEDVKPEAKKPAADSKKKTAAPEAEDKDGK